MCVFPIAKFLFPYVSGKYRESIIGSKYQMYKRKVVIGLIIFIRCVSIHFPPPPLFPLFPVGVELKEMVHTYIKCARRRFGCVDRRHRWLGGSFWMGQSHSPPQNSFFLFSSCWKRNSIGSEPIDRRCYCHFQLTTFTHTNRLAL